MLIQQDNVRVLSIGDTSSLTVVHFSSINQFEALLQEFCIFIFLAFLRLLKSYVLIEYSNNSIPY